MKILSVIVLVVTTAVLVGCSTTASRIKERQSAFESYPVETQQKIRAGDVSVGFTTEQVELALGKPDRIFTHESEAGPMEIWAYRESQPALSLGLGIFGGGATSIGGGVGVGTGGEGAADKIRISFVKGVVSAIERSTTP